MLGLGDWTQPISHRQWAESIAVCFVFVRGDFQGNNLFFYFANVMACRVTAAVSATRSYPVAQRTTAEPELGEE